MKRVLFVCTGNSCRSPMAEGLLRHMAPTGSVEVASAGIAAGTGEAASANAVTAMKQLGIDISGHRTRRVNEELVRTADAIFVMTYAHLDMMLLLFPGAADRLFLVREFEDDLAPDERDVHDPIGGGMAAYQATRDQLREVMPAIITYVLTSHSPDALMKENQPRIHVAIGADHGGFQLKQSLVREIHAAGFEVRDLGTDSKDSVDYPDFAQAVGGAVAAGEAGFGVLICRTGIGMSMSANQIPGVRAALVTNGDAARLSRQHNNANVICLAGDGTDPADAAAWVREFLTTKFEGGRHARRVDKIARGGGGAARVRRTDPGIATVIESEERRQSENIELIASENFTSGAVMAAQGSCLTNKYAEGYPGKRWYGGCEHVDVAETLAIDRAKELFRADHANVQPHSGSQANTAVYFSVLKPGDRILTMNLAHGGHLTHGHPMNFSGRLYEVVHYGVSEDTEAIDYDALARQAADVKPRMITVGASAYSRIIDFERMRAIADSVGAYLFADMAHIAGLVAAGLHPSPVPHADFVTTTTHKTLRGPRGGLILCRAQYAKDIDSLVFPGVQGGPLMHVIAAKAVCFHEALQPGFAAYQKQVVVNARALCDRLKALGYRIVSGTTENHLMLVDLQPRGLTGKDAQEALDHAGITVNKNAIPFDKQSPFKAGGMRLGTPAVTTRGFREAEMVLVADLIHEVLEHRADAKRIESVRERVRALMAKFPLPA